MPPRAAQQPSPVSPTLVAVVGLLLAVVALVVRAPWGLVAWAGLWVAAMCAAPPVLSGRKDAAGRPTAADPAQTKAMGRYQMWTAARSTLVLPSAAWLPGKHLRLSWIAAVATGALAAASPQAAWVPAWGPVASGVAAFAAVVGLDKIWRTGNHPFDPTPGVGLRDVLSRFDDDPPLIAVTLAGSALAVAAGALTLVALPAGVLASGRLSPLAAPVALTALLAVVPPWLRARGPVLAPWRATIEARAVWEGRWATQKLDPAPYLVSHEVVGPAIVDTFEAPAAAGGAAAFIGRGPMLKLAPAVGAGTRVVALTSPDTDPATGSPVPGTVNPGRFRIVCWPSDAMPDITAPDTDPDLAAVAIESATAWACDSFTYGHPALTSCTLVSDVEPADEEPASPAVWATSWSVFVTSVNQDLFQRQIAPAVAGELGTIAVHDRRAGSMFVGPWEGARLSRDFPLPPKYSGRAPAKYLGDVTEEIEWDGRWRTIVKQGAATPTPQLLLKTASRLPDGTEIHYLPFLTRAGITPQDAYDAAPKLATNLSAAPFCTVVPYLDGQAPTGSGTRHAQAFAVAWATAAVPTSPARLTAAPASSATSATQLVLRTMVNRAFDAAKLPWPELVDAKALTRKESRTHVWQLRLRLYSTTLDAVRAAQTKLQTALGVPWLRLTAADDGFITMYVGGDTQHARFTSPEQSKKLVASLDWEQAFSDTNIVGVGGRVPKLTGRSTMPRNDQVEVLDFDLPTPISVERLRGVLAKLKAASGNLFVEVRQGEGGASTARILACRTDPMPTKAGYDFGLVRELAAEGRGRIAFATGVDGEPVIYDPKLDPHVLAAGVTGAGKSVLMQSFTLGAIANGWDVYIADPTKGAADFKFAEPYARAIAVDLFAAAGMMKSVYGEVLARKRVNSAHGVGNYRDLPPDLRPPHIMLVIDEFTSLMGTDVVPKASEDPELEHEREQVIAANMARQQIGSFTGKITREARSAGVTLVLGTQKLSAAMLDQVPNGADIKTNLSRLLLGKATQGERQSALRGWMDAPDLGDSVPPGRGLWETTAAGAQIIQSWYDPGEQGTLRDELVSIADPLGDHERLDLAQFAAPSTEGPRVREVFDEDDYVEEDEEVDLGTIELTLDMLGMDAASDGEPDASVSGATAPEDDDEPDAREVDESTAVLLDCDGTIAAGFAGNRDNHTPGLMARLGALPARLGWLTDWEHAAKDEFDVDLDRRDTFVLERGAAATGWWKLDALVAYLDAHPEVNRLAWCDDHLDDTDPLLGITWLEVAAEILDRAGREHLLLACDGRTGLTNAQVDRLEEFCGGESRSTDRFDSEPQAQPEVEAAPSTEPRAEPDPEPDVEPLLRSAAADPPPPPPKRRRPPAIAGLWDD